MTINEGKQPFCQVFGRHTRARRALCARSLQHSQIWAPCSQSKTWKRAKLFFLQHWPFQVSQGVTRAECVIPAHVVFVAEPPGRLSWENTEPGSGCPWTDPDLWIHKDPYGPSGWRKIIWKGRFWAQSWNTAIILTDGAEWMCAWELVQKRQVNRQRLRERRWKC